MSKTLILDYTPDDNQGHYLYQKANIFSQSDKNEQIIQRKLEQSL
jgi:hypothetical protein